MAKSPKRKAKGKKKRVAPTKAHAPLHGTQPGDKISGDRIYVTARKSGVWKGSVRRSAAHHAFSTTAKMGAVATVEQGFTNVKS